MFKRLTITIALLIFVGSALFYRSELQNLYDRVAYFSFCEKPILYRIGTIDPKFKISNKEFIEIATQSANIWSTAYNKPLFEYSPDGTLDINLVYDERQTLLNSISTMNRKVEGDREGLEEKIESFKNWQSDLETRLGDLNKEIAEWNEKGGAPPEVYEELSKKQKELRVEINEINQTAENLNQSSDLLNQKVSNLNETITSFNSILKIRPEEGVFVPIENRIDIYFYSNESELKHTLAHELGHALGLGHIDTQDAIMNPVVSDEIQLTDDDLKVLSSFCEEQNRFLLLKNDLQTIINSYILMLQR